MGYLILQIVKDKICSIYPTMKRALILSLIFGLVPGWFLYKVIYSFYHDQAVWKDSNYSFSHLYSGESLKIHAFTDLLFYLCSVLLLSYFASSGTLLLGGKGTAKTRARNFFSQAFNPQTLIPAIIGSIIYLPIIFFLSSGVNPW